MGIFDTVKKNLEDRGYAVEVFASGAEAAAYLDGAVDGKSVGFGGSMTLDQLGLYDALGKHNTVVWHWKQDAGPARREGMFTDVYLSSANGLAETGEIVNIDGNGNRVAATLFGHEKVYLVIGRNKLAPTYEEALWRARNVASPRRGDLGAGPKRPGVPLQRQRHRRDRGADQHRRHREPGFRVHVRQGAGVFYRRGE